MSKILEVKDLHAFYGKSHILHGVSLDVNEGELVTLLGRNGAGKSTTIRSLMGLMKSMKGSVKMFGKEVAGWAPFRIAASGVGYVPEGRRVFAEPHGGREPQGARASARGRGRPQKRLRTLPATRRAQGQQGPAAFGRRAGDALDRARAAC